MDVSLSVMGTMIAGHFVFFGIVFLLVLQAVCSGICAVTPTPPAGSKMAKVYKVVEVIGLAIGWAKDTGILTPTAAEALAAKDALALGRSVIQTIAVAPHVPADQIPPPTLADMLAALRAEGLLHATPVVPPVPPVPGAPLAAPLV